MIQRLQTILLFFAAAFNVAFLFVPNWVVINPQSANNDVSTTIYATPLAVNVSKSQMDIDNPFTETTISFSQNTFLTLQLVAVIAVSLLLLVTIFLYSNRGLQIKLAYAAILLLMAQFLTSIPIRSWLVEMGGVPGDIYQNTPQYGLAFPLLALLLTWWSIKRIQKDEKLVQGMDRLR